MDLTTTENKSHLPAETSISEQKKPFMVVAIGASAGGLEAVTELLKHLSPTTGMAFIYVQHLSPDHKSLLPSLLSKVTKMTVQDIDDMEKIEPNNVYVIPYNKVIVVTDGHIKLIPRPALKTYVLSIDVLFTSLAKTHKENVIGIVLSGSANDGTQGLKEIKLAGGITFAQDDSAKFTSMPHSAIHEGVVDFVFSPKEISKKLNWISKHTLVKPTIMKSAPEDDIENNNAELITILGVLLKDKRVDFSHYKMNTIKRRIIRRMMINKIKTLKLYAEFIQQKNNEIDLLYQDLLINVTDFFRDTDAFKYLKVNLLPRIISTKLDGETLRVWVAACATGEEVYSIAMLLLEMNEKSATNITFQLFATDLSPDAIAEARLGEYTFHQLKNVSPSRIKKFFVKSKEKYRILKSVRDVCVFAQHNILSDPPFSRMDLISCRNFLIYLDATAQKKAISSFHYGLNETGFLMLGKSETIGTSEKLFTEVDKKFKVYARKKNSAGNRIPDLSPRLSHINTSETNNNINFMANVRKPSSSSNNSLSSAFDAVLLAQFIPASVVINLDLEILQFRGSTSMYLQHSPGRASFNILKMSYIEITFELRNAIHHAIKTKRKVRKSGIEMSPDLDKNTIQIVNIEVTPIEVEGEHLLVVVFSGHKIELEATIDNGIKNNSIAKDRRIKKLEEELAAARSDMGSITQDQEAANEELQSANEEIVSSNEELQSLNEELETSKEEIESTNEELTSSNLELHARIQQIEDLNHYNQIILDTIHEPMLVLDKRIRIVSANKSFCATFHVTEKECLGVSLYNLGNNQWDILRLRELLEDIVPKNIHFQDFEVEHTFPVIGHKTMLLNAHRILQHSQNEELIVLSIFDITEVKRLAIELQEKENKALEVKLDAKKKTIKLMEDSNKRYNLLLLQSPFSIAILKGMDMVVNLANDSIKEMWSKGDDIEGVPLLTLFPELVGSDFPKLLEQVYTTGEAYFLQEHLSPIVRNGKHMDAYFNIVYQPYRETDDSISGITVIAYEVTSQVLAKNDLREAICIAEREKLTAENAVNAKQQFLSNMSHEIRTPMNAIIGFTNVLLKTKINISQKEYLNAIKVSGDALVVLVNDILDLAKVDAGKMTFDQTSFSLHDSISSMLLLFETKIKEKNLVMVQEFDSLIPSYLIGDPIRLRQIILNLVSNAVKFTNKGKITVKVKMLKKTAETTTIEFTVSDTGIGIPEDKLDLIFKIFEQATTTTSNSYGGSGLGLAIVKQFVEMQGGSIFVHSEMGIGSTLGFVLSFNNVDILNDKSPFIHSQALSTDFSRCTLKKTIKVLVVEDVALNQLLIKIILLDFGFEIDIVNNGQEAIDILQKNTYDIVLMDLHMPIMNGFDATTYIRHQLHLQVPIIALTADVTTVDVDNCIAVGMNDYISKPIDETLLYSKIVKCLD